MITFTRTTQTYDASADSVTSLVTTITGDAMEVEPRQSDLKRYEEHGLRLTETVMLLFTPTTYGDLPAPGDVITWPNASNGVAYTVRDVNPLRPDGVTILARVACSR